MFLVQIPATLDVLLNDIAVLERLSLRLLIMCYTLFAVAMLYTRSTLFDQVHLAAVCHLLTPS